jgi:hypothetical protein
MRLFINPRVDRASPYPQSMKPILSLAAEGAARPTAITAAPSPGARSASAAAA